MNKRIRVKICLLLFLLSTGSVSAQHPDLKTRIQNITNHKNATIGIAIEGDNGQDTLTVHGRGKFPMHSVFKYHIAAVVLHEVDQAKLKLNDKIEIKKQDLANNLYSPIRDKYPDGVTMTLSKLLEYAVAESDNVACDLLLGLIGGPVSVENYMHACGIENIAIKYNEATQESKWEYQYENWITPEAANRSLKVLFENHGSVLSGKRHKLLWDIMKSAKTGGRRIRANLPSETVIAHKTGSSGKNGAGLTGACNDIGIIFLPNGRYFYLSVFVRDSKESEAENEKIIADVAAAAWNYFQAHYK